MYYRFSRGKKMMDDLQILKQLYNGNHLNDNEMERATKIIYLLDNEIKRRIK